MLSITTTLCHLERSIQLQHYTHATQKGLHLFAIFVILFWDGGCFECQDKNVVVTLAQFNGHPKLYTHMCVINQVNSIN